MTWWRSRSRNARLAMGVAIFAFAVASMVTFAVVQIGEQEPSGRARAGGSLGLEVGGFADRPCEQLGAGTIALIGRLAPGSDAGRLLGSGYMAHRAIDGAEPDLVVLYPASGRLEYGEGAQAAARDLQSNPALTSIGLLGSRANDLSLRSCQYRFEDNPAAEAMARRTMAWIVSNNILTQAQIDAPGTTFQLTEDPTNPTHLFLTIVLAKPVGGLAPGSPELSDGLTPYTATIDSSTGEILSAGRAHWYDFQ